MTISAEQLAANQASAANAAVNVSYAQQTINAQQQAAQAAAITAANQAAAAAAQKQAQTDIQNPANQEAFNQARTTLIASGIEQGQASKTGSAASIAKEVGNVGGVVDPGVAAIGKAETMAADRAAAGKSSTYGDTLTGLQGGSPGVGPGSIGTPSQAINTRVNPIITPTPASLGAVGPSAAQIAADRAAAGVTLTGVQLTGPNAAEFASLGANQYVTTDTGSKSIQYATLDLINPLSSQVAKQYNLILTPLQSSLIDIGVSSAKYLDSLNRVTIPGQIQGTVPTISGTQIANIPLIGAAALGLAGWSMGASTVVRDAFSSFEKVLQAAQPPGIYGAAGRAQIGLTVGFAEGIPESLIALGIFPAAGLAILTQPQAMAGAVIPGVQSVVKQVTEDPARFAGNIVSMLVMPKVMGKISEGASYLNPISVGKAEIPSTIPGELTSVYYAKIKGASEYATPIGQKIGSISLPSFDNLDLRTFDAARTFMLDVAPEKIYYGIESIKAAPYTVASSLSTLAASDIDLRAIDSARTFILDVAPGKMYEVAQYPYQIAGMANKATLAAMQYTGDLRTFDAARTFILDTLPEYTVNAVNYRPSLPTTGPGAFDLVALDSMRTFVLDTIGNKYIPSMPDIGFKYMPGEGVMAYIAFQGKTPASALLSAAGFEIPSTGIDFVSKGSELRFQNVAEAREYYETITGKKGTFYHGAAGIKDVDFINNLLSAGEVTVSSEKPLYFGGSGEVYERFLVSKGGYSPGGSAILRLTETPKTIGEALSFEGSDVLNPKLPEGLYPGPKGLLKETRSDIGFYAEYIVPSGSKISVTDISYIEIVGSKIPLIDIKIGEPSLIDTASLAVKKAVINLETIRSPLGGIGSPPDEFFDIIGIELPNPLEEVAAKQWSTGVKEIVNPYIIQRMAAKEGANAAVRTIAYGLRSQPLFREAVFVQRETVGEILVNKFLTEDTIGKIFKNREAMGADVVSGGSTTIRANLGKSFFGVDLIGDLDAWVKQDMVSNLWATERDIISTEQPSVLIGREPGLTEGFMVGKVKIPGEEKPLVEIHSIEQFPWVAEQRNIGTLEAVGGAKVTGPTTGYFGGLRKMSAAFDDQYFSKPPGGEFGISLNPETVKHAVGNMLVSREAASLYYGRDNALTGMQPNYVKGQVLERFSTAMDELLGATTGEERATVDRYLNSVETNPLTLPETQTAKFTALSNLLLGNKEKYYSGIPYGDEGVAYGKYPFEKTLAESNDYGIIGFGVGLPIVRASYPGVAYTVNVPRARIQSFSDYVMGNEISYPEQQYPSIGRSQGGYASSVYPSINYPIGRNLPSNYPSNYPLAATLKYPSGYPSTTPGNYPTGYTPGGSTGTTTKTTSEYVTEYTPFTPTESYKKILFGPKPETTVTYKRKRQAGTYTLFRELLPSLSPREELGGLVNLKPFYRTIGAGHIKKVTPVSEPDYLQSVDIDRNLNEMYQGERQRKAQEPPQNIFGGKEFFRTPTKAEKAKTGQNILRYNPQAGDTINNMLFGTDKGKRRKGGWF